MRCSVTHPVGLALLLAALFHPVFASDDGDSVVDRAPKQRALTPLTPEPENRVDWAGVSRSSARFLAIQHGFRILTEPGTRQGLRGRFFDNYRRAAANIHGWSDASGRRVPAITNFELRDFPTRFNDVRVPGYQNWDASVAKFFPIREQIRLQFRFEMINAFNRPWFSNLASGALDVTNNNFGRLDATQRNLPRFIKLALNLAW